MKHAQQKIIHSVSVLSFFRPFVLVSILLLALGMLWLNHQVNSLSAKQDILTRAPAPKGTYTNKNGVTSPVTSDKEAFTLMIPDGWGPFIRPMNSDTLLLPGTTQPITTPGRMATVNSVPSYGSDNLQLIYATLQNSANLDIPQSAVEDFPIGKGETFVTGKKYTYIYPNDTLIGIGDPRFQGDRDYTYVIPHDNKQFVLTYSVYASDPRNLSRTVDEIVRSVSFK